MFASKNIFQVFAFRKDYFFLLSSMIQKRKEEEEEDESVIKKSPKNFDCLIDEREKKKINKKKE